MLDKYENLIQGVLENDFGSVDDFFTGGEIIRFRQTLVNQYKQDQFNTAGIGNQFNRVKNKEIRNDQIKWLNRSTTLESEQVFFQKIDAFTAYLNQTCFTGITETEFHYALYPHGSFYKRHADRFSNDDRRKFSFVLYLTDDWQTGDGGELQIYRKGLSHTIQPKAGTIVFFDSCLEHEVLVSKTNRMSLTGWFKTV